MPVIFTATVEKNETAIFLSGLITVFIVAMLEPYLPMLA
jgi:hypothetical protein